jgi:glycerophosphoryl diester phosphodiesterase
VTATPGTGVVPGPGGRTVNRFLAALRPPRTRPLVVAHRGASAFAPENTLEAAEEGLAEGADAWEFDVRLTRDGVPVVVHDASLLRTTDVAGRFPDDPRGANGYLVAEFEAEEIRGLDAGSWFVAAGGGKRSADWFGTRAELSDAEVARYAARGVRVPTLRECLEWTRQAGWLANVEVKTWPGHDRTVVAAVLAEVAACRVADRVLISSFDHDDVAEVARSRLPVATGVLALQPFYQPARYVREVVGADCYHPSAEALGACPDGGRVPPGVDEFRAEDLHALRRADVPVLCYTVNDASPGGLARRLAVAGVSALFTDDPRGMRRAFDGDGR